MSPELQHAIEQATRRTHENDAGMNLAVIAIAVAIGDLADAIREGERRDGPRDI